MKNRAIVTGANGHLGCNLVMQLRAQHIPVIAAFRNTKYIEKFETLGCDTATIDLLNKNTLLDAFQKADVLYHTAAVFKHWAKNPQREIYDANMIGTRNVMEAARETGIKKIIYISSLAALDRTHTPITENSWNPDRSNTYFRSKTDSEKLAWELSKEYNLDMISILPSAMINGNFTNLTPTMSLLSAVLNGELGVDPGFYLNFVDVEQVAQACINAMTNGHTGERYLIANHNCTSIRELFTIAKEAYPNRNLKTPSAPPKALLYMAAYFMELFAKLFGREPLLQRNFLKAFTVEEICDVSKASRELDFKPSPPAQIITSTFRRLESHT